MASNSQRSACLCFLVLGLKAGDSSDVEITQHCVRPGFHFHHVGTVYGTMIVMVSSKGEYNALDLNSLSIYILCFISDKGDLNF